MFYWLYCCTTGYRKAALVQGTVPPVPMHKGRSLSTCDLPDSSISGTSSRNDNLFREDLKLLSYNIFVRPDMPMGFSSEYQDERIEIFANNVLANYDIVCLQEMFSIPLSSRRHSFIEQAKGLGFYWHHLGKRNYSLSPTIDGGLLILSKLPIVKTDALTFSSAAFADWYAEKGVLYCLIQTGPSEGHYLHLFNTHLQATYDDKGKTISRNVRREQVIQTVDFINKCIKNREEWPIVICGDMNVQSRTSPLDGSDSGEYTDVINIIRTGLGLRGELLRDLTKEIDGFNHPVTYADSVLHPDGSVHPKEDALTDVSALKNHTTQCNQSLDKIFWIPSPERRPVMEPASTLINHMIIDKTTWKNVPDLPLTHLSDHYAVETSVKVKLPSNAGLNP